MGMLNAPSDHDYLTDFDRDPEEHDPTYEEMAQTAERLTKIVSDDAIERAQLQQRIAELEGALDLVITAPDLVSAKSWARDARFGIEIG